MKKSIEHLRNEIESLRGQAVRAHMLGNKPAAECLTGKVIGMKTTLNIVDRLADDPKAVGEIEGMERVIEVLGPLPRC